MSYFYDDDAEVDEVDVRSFAATEEDDEADVRSFADDVEDEEVSPASVKPRPVLSLGKRGGHVNYLQSRLGVDAHGIFDSATDEALREFQSENGLKVDGVVGEATWMKVG